MPLLPIALCLFLQTADEPPPPPEGLATPEATAAWTEGVARFLRGEFDPADESFQLAKKGAKGDAKERTAAYIKACAGAKKLPKIEKGIQDEKWRAAWLELGKLAKTHGDGPLAVHLAPLRETIEGQLFFPLANFEAEPPAPEAKVKERRPDSAKPNSDEKYVSEGKGSLRWASGSGPGFAGMAFGIVPLAAFDGAKIEEFPFLEIAIYSTDENFGKFTLYFGTEEDGPQPMFAGTDLLKTRCFLHHITVQKEGWHVVRVDLRKDITKNNSVEWKEVTGVSLMVIPPSHPKTIYIDGLRLERP